MSQYLAFLQAPQRLAGDLTFLFRIAIEIALWKLEVSRSPLDAVTSWHIWVTFVSIESIDMGWLQKMRLDTLFGNVLPAACRDRRISARTCIKD